jgi:hypothetical protein
MFEMVQKNLDLAGQIKKHAYLAGERRKIWEGDVHARQLGQKIHVSFNFGGNWTK